MTAASTANVPNISATEAWGILRAQSDAVLIDVRTRPEWQYVGIPDLAGIGRPLVKLEWQVWPDMAVNPRFAEALKQAVPAGAQLLFLCRSGARSLAAAKLAMEHGFTRCFNIASGFEGGLDPSRHRVGPAGWKHEGLPWIQD